jgi:16S rRNA (cytosine1402-N4)-methyltransferase
MNNQQHIPVLLHETLSGLHLSPNATIIDATLGGGGHSREILKRIAPRGIVIGFDRDAATLTATSAELQKEFGDRFIGIHDSYSHLDHFADELLRHSPVTGILADLGYSSIQIDDPSRGFSFHGNGPLDMRFDQTTGITAAELINTASEEELARIFRDYGEYPQARKLARAIACDRECGEW